ncbi:hypothetical protein [Moraxella cuniculi]|uniref:hypothetical protein n=1 Tax=Moraxella cuniculi TaxID=34061 RepID=UPI0018D57AD6|nr:hypothetical protein [Moraxella cuniculi]
MALLTLQSHVEKGLRGRGKLHNIDEAGLRKLVIDIGYNKDALQQAKAIVEHSIKIRKAEKSKQPNKRLDKGHQERVQMEQRILNRINNMLREIP